mmetsp:Transcript_13861/g.38962  ORF Transcript_13861/g.38962 Transcript_13861/m.38962 type:complete len:591 (-) Transcript_13861:1513-3285(-)
MAASPPVFVHGTEDVVLPGYEAGVEQSGVEHSRLKLRESTDRLSATLAEIDRQSRIPPGSDCGKEDGCAEPSSDRDRDADRDADRIRIQTLQCHSEEETWTYRCRCNFQIVVTEASPGPVYRYAMRSKGQPVLLGTKNTFPIATRRIQAAMGGFMEYLNGTEGGDDNTEGYGCDDDDDDDDDDEGDTKTDGQLNVVGRHLTSCTFSSAWRDTPDADCILTLHYDHPLESVRGPWTEQAGKLCHRLGLRQMNGRSKGTLLSVGRVEPNTTAAEDNHGSNDRSTGGSDDETEWTIRDTVYLRRRRCSSASETSDNGTTREEVVEWNVSLEREQSPAGAPTSALLAIIPVHYEKPETAFYHPNPNAMTKALAWMLNRLASISLHKQGKKLKLLEMYCGCGAHTVALGRSGLVQSILAVELDPRLVRACERNLSRNGLEQVVEIRRGDAGKWAREESRRSRRRRWTEITTASNPNDNDDDNSDSDIDIDIDNDNDDEGRGYDVLLVDPPRQGLDNEVCRMAMMSLGGEQDATGVGDRGTRCFRNLLYVSCGHRALLRDLERLSPVYEVVDCAQMDLFPRTDSIETLVHLRKRNP